MNIEELQKKANKLKEDIILQLLIYGNIEVNTETLVVKGIEEKIVIF